MFSPVSLYGRLCGKTPNRVSLVLFSIENGTGARPDPLKKKLGATLSRGGGIIPSENCIYGTCASHGISGLVVNVIRFDLLQIPLLLSQEIFRLYFFYIVDELELYSCISFLFHYNSE